MNRVLFTVLTVFTNVITVMAIDPHGSRVDHGGGSSSGAGAILFLLLIVGAIFLFGGKGNNRK